MGIYIFIFCSILIITFIYMFLYFMNRLFDDVHKTLVDAEQTHKVIKENQNIMKENQKQLIEMLQKILNEEKTIENDIHKIKDEK